MFRSIREAASVLGLAGVLSFSGCFTGNDRGGDVGVSREQKNTATGAVGLALLLADGSDVTTVNYVVRRNGVSVRTGPLAVGADGRASGTITGLDAGVGYVVSLDAPRFRDGGAVTPCTGESAPFTVIENDTVPVSVVLQCDDTSATGNVALNGQFNVCPKLTSASATPITQALGGNVTLSASAVDKDGDLLSYAWYIVPWEGGYSASSVFATTQTATFRCNAEGTTTINVAVYDGSSRGCRRSLNAPLYVTCTGNDFPPPPPPGISLACDRCLRAQCNPQFGFLFLVDDCVDAACDAAFNCFQRNRCAVDTFSVHKCYCGDVTLEACRAADYDATGPCANLVEQGLGTTVASEVIERFVDRDTATGDGIALFGCATENCLAECVTAP